MRQIKAPDNVMMSIDPRAAAPLRARLAEIEETRKALVSGGGPGITLPAKRRELKALAREAETLTDQLPAEHVDEEAAVCWALGLLAADAEAGRKAHAVLSAAIAREADELDNMDFQLGRAWVGKLSDDLRQKLESDLAAEGRRLDVMARKIIDYAETALLWLPGCTSAGLINAHRAIKAEETRLWVRETLRPLAETLTNLWKRLPPYEVHRPAGSVRVLVPEDVAAELKANLSLVHNYPMIQALRLAGPRWENTARLLFGDEDRPTYSTVDVMLDSDAMTFVVRTAVLTRLQDRTLLLTVIA